jgi:outer membrane biogenesis lipoprotein LolB
MCYSCHPAKKIQAVIPKKDTTVAPETAKSEQAKKDSIAFIKQTFSRITDNIIEFTTFSAKIDLDYEDGEGKKTNVNAHLRMYRDSLIWISLTGPLGIEGLRILIDRDSVRILDKQNKIYTVRSIPFLQELTALPLDLSSLQDMLVGNPVFLDPLILSYAKTETSITLQTNSEYFKNLFTVDAKTYLAETSKLDDLDPQRNRTCYLTYSDYEDKKRVNFSTKRRIRVSEKKKTDIKLDFKQYDFNEKLSFSFNVPKNYERN